MRFMIGTAHFFSPLYRDAGMHRFAKTLAAKGHHIDFVTFGQSWLKRRTNAATRRYARSADAAARGGVNPRNIYAHVHREAFHPPSGSARAERLTRPLERLYGRRLDKWTEAAVRKADVIILESGYSIYYFEEIKRRNPDATLVAFYNDRLDLVGFRSEVIVLNNRLMPQFDLVRTNAEALLSYLPPKTKACYVPQGVDKEKIRFDLPSPYEAGSRNIVSVGNMLFDAPAICEVAAAALAMRAEVHVIGAAMESPPDNVILHGELPFEQTLPFIVHADVGIAPYLPVDGADYLAQSSLKIQQYKYCGLPILIARKLGISGNNFFIYDRDQQGDVARALERAFARGKERDEKQHIPSWDEVGDILIDAIQAAAAEC